MIGDQAAVGCAKVFDTAPQPSGRRIWGGMEFDGPWKAFWVPQIDYVDGVEMHHSGSAQLPDRPIMENGANIDLDEWTKKVDHVLDRIENNQLDKVVLARKVTVDAFEIDPSRLNFWFQPTPDVIFMGMSPERLFWRDGDQLFSEALAGTDIDGDKLLASEKDQREFLFVQNDLLQKFNQLCTDVDSSPIGLKQAGPLFHLHSTFQGRLKSNVTEQYILDLLHPTPAMGGAPWICARKMLKELESFNRGWYASPLGFYTNSSAQFMIGIRSLIKVKNKMHLFSGTGIVKGSDPIKEWKELNRKVEAWTQAS